MHAPRNAKTATMNRTLCAVPWKNASAITPSRTAEMYHCRVCVRSHAMADLHLPLMVPHGGAACRHWARADGTRRPAAFQLGAASCSTPRGRPPGYVSVDG